MPVDIVALVATGASSFVKSELSAHFQSSRLNQVFDDAARSAVISCEEEFPAGTPQWTEFVSFLNTPRRVEQLVETLLYQRALPDCPGWCQPLLEGFLLRLSTALVGATAGNGRGGFLGLSMQLAVMEQRLSSQINSAAPRPLSDTLDRQETAPQTSDLARRAISLVGAMDGGVPLAVLRNALGVSEAEWGSIVDEIQAYVTLDDEDYLCPLPSLPRLDPETVEGIDDLFGVWLLAMPELRRKPGASRALNEVLRLGKHLSDESPDRVAGVFRATEKVSKDLGDQRLVHQAAELAISSARRSATREDPVLRLEAQALICGRSWVWQRHGDLARAEESAYESLALGKAIGDGVNTAYTLKCLGRLFRIQAERSFGEAAAELVEKSIRYLQDARRAFQDLRPAGDGDSEVGDCLSLEGRSQFVAGRLSEARSLVMQSFDFLDNPSDKDYLDACILLSDVLRAEGDLAAAIKALKPVWLVNSANDSPKSEVIARAFVANGEIAALRGRKGTARSAFSAASDIYRLLGDHDRADRLKWRAVQFGSIRSELNHALLAQPPSVCWRVVESFETSVPTGARKRAHITPERVNRMIVEAQRDAAAGAPRWPQ